MKFFTEQSTPATFSLSDPNILLSTLLPNTLDLCPSLSATDQVLHPYRTDTIIL